MKPHRQTLILAVLLVPAVAAADGGFFYNSKTTTSPPDMHSQRGLLVVEPDRFELHVQSRYQGDPKDFAWVIPIPALPEVGEGNAELLDQLDALTAPRFVTITHTYPCYQGGGGMDGGMAGAPGEGITERGKVTIWSTGQVGILSYTVLQATSNSVLADWLANNAFDLPPEFVATLSYYVSQNFYFFAAKITPGVDDVRKLQPVKLVFAPEVKPIFPMRVTAISSSGAVDVLLFVVGSSAYLPSTYPVDRVGFAKDPDDYEAEFDKVASQNSGRTFVVQYSNRLYTSDDESWLRTYLRSELEGKEPLDELVNLLKDDRHLTRLKGRLDAAGMTEDLLFSPESEYYVSNVFENYEYDYEECHVDNPGPDAKDGAGGCQVAPLTALPPLGLVVLLLVLGLWVRRR